MENKTKSRENKSHNILQVPNLQEPALSLYGDLLSYYPHIKFLGITFDNKMNFTKHFEEILERCNQKFDRLSILVNRTQVRYGKGPVLKTDQNLLNSLE